MYAVTLVKTIIFQVYTDTNFRAKAELLTPTPRRLNSAKKSLVTHYKCWFLARNNDISRFYPITERTCLQNADCARSSWCLRVGFWRSQILYFGRIFLVFFSGFVFFLSNIVIFWCLKVNGIASKPFFMKRTHAGTVNNFSACDTQITKDIADQG